MKIRRILITLCALWLVLMAAQPVLAKGPFACLLVSGGGLSGELEINEPALLEFFSFAEMFTARLPQAPDNAEDLLVQAYDITRFAQDESNGKLVPFDRLHFVPSEGEEPGLVYYDGIINGSSEYDKQWYKAHPQVEAVFQRIIRAQLDPVGSFLDERRGLITTLGIILSVTALVEWLRERRKQAKHTV